MGLEDPNIILGTGEHQETDLLQPTQLCWKASGALKCRASGNLVCLYFPREGNIIRELLHRLMNPVLDKMVLLPRPRGRGTMEHMEEQSNMPPCQ